jgi:hypothetical protein
VFLYDAPAETISFPLNPGAADDINDAGQILAATVLPSGVFSAVILGGAGANLGASFGAPFDGKQINALGHVVGGPAQPPNHLNSYLFSQGTFEPISGASGFYGNAINNNNEIAGFIREQTPFFGIRARAAKRDRNGAIQVFGSFSVASDATAVAINGHGQIVGTERGGGVLIPFLIENGLMRNVNALLPAGSGWQLFEAHDINDRGEIVGMGRINGQNHAFLLTPLVCSSAEDSDSDGNADNDSDGLCDSWETEGVDGDDDGRIDLVLTGANPNRKDLFVEIDYMFCEHANFQCFDEHSHRPLDEALARVTSAFANAPVVNPDLSFGITLHMQVDEAVAEIRVTHFLNAEPGARDDFNDVKRGNPAVECGAGAASFGTLQDRLHEDCSAILRARELVFRYAVFGHEHAGRGSSGIAEIGGNDFMVTLGSFDDDDYRANGGTADVNTARIEVEAATFMHEFGHTLGLRHGGGDHINCKPNYLSLMNYSFQFQDLVIGRPFDYSFPRLATLDEHQLDEAAGVGGFQEQLTVFGFGPGGGPLLAGVVGPIDWDQDGQSNAGVSLDLSYIPAGGCETAGKTFLTGFDDWSNIQYDFRHSPDFADGTTRSTVGPEPERTDDEGLAAAQSIDFDGDGTTNFPDNCPGVANPTQQDTDGDGIGDACESGPPADVTPPALTLPAALTAVATSAAGAGVSFTATADDTVDGARAVNCVPVSGSTFPIGTTRVTCDASDASGNQATGFFDVTVQLGQPRIAGTIAGRGRDAAGRFYVDLSLANTGTGHARAVTIATLTFRTLSGTGIVTYDAAASGPLPTPLGDLDVGATTARRLFVNVPSTVTRFSVTEGGTVRNVAGTTMSYAAAQSVIP